MNSSHSVPVSPSRPPQGLPLGAVKFFPLPSIHGLRAADDMDLIRNSRRKAMFETIPEIREEGEVVGKVGGLGVGLREVGVEEEDGGERRSQQPPSEKRARLDENLGIVMDGGVGKPRPILSGGVGGGGVSAHVPPSLGSMVALSSGMPSVQHTAVPGATGLQYIPIPLMSTAAGLSGGGGHAHQTHLRPPHTHHQNLQLGPHQLPSFLTQSFFNCGGQAVSQAISTPVTVALANPPSATTKTNGGVAHGNGME